MSKRDHTTSTVPLLRENPHKWCRHASKKQVLIRRNDVNKDILQVIFLSAEDASKFLIRLRNKAKGIEGMTRTEIQREKLRKGTTGW